MTPLSFDVQGGTSCGVVGRTGSGKSSLMLTLFRLIDVNLGTIYLDGVDTSKIGLDALRSQLAIIPQVRQKAKKMQGQIEFGRVRTCDQEGEKMKW